MIVEPTSTAASAAKAGIAWTGVAFSYWSDFAPTVAATLAAIYSLLLIVDWFWKRWRK